MGTKELTPEPKQASEAEAPAAGSSRRPTAPREGRARALLNRLARSSIRGSTGLPALAIFVGAGAGVGAVAFRYMIDGLTYVFTGHTHYGFAGHVPNPSLPGLGFWFLLFVPVVGGLIYGPLVSRLAPEARGHGVPEVMDAVSRRGGRMRGRVPVVKSVASAVCIGSGGSVGREGPIVQIGSALGSLTGQLVRLPEQQLRLLIACGAAGGISATFNAPIAGVFFALELILRSFETRSFGAVVLSSVTANAIGRAAFGSHPFLALPAFTFRSPLELVLYGLMGAMASVVGIAFIRLLYGGESAADRIWAGRPEWLRPAVGGILLGLLLVAVPQMYGVGYPVMLRAIGGHYVTLALLGLLAAKLLATSMTMWIGGSGGVFAPSLFMGAMLGTAFGSVADALIPGSASAAGAYGLVGMGAVFAATARAPMTAVIIIFELTGDYRIILPLMIAVVVSTALANAITSDTIYTLKLRRRGVDIDTPPAVKVVDAMSVADAMAAPSAPLLETESLQAMISRFASEPVNVLPVIDAHRRLLGLVDAAEVEAAIGRGPDGMSARDLMRVAPLLRAGDTLQDAARALAGDEEGVPVIDPRTEELIGWITYRELFEAYRRMVSPPGHVT